MIYEIHAHLVSNFDQRWLSRLVFEVFLNFLKNSVDFFHNLIERPLK
jgi:hypothetical protein